MTVQQQAEKGMVDRVRITRVSGGMVAPGRFEVDDEDEDRIYEGCGFVGSIPRQSDAATQGGQERLREQKRLRVPASVKTVRAGDIVTVLESSDDSLVSTRLEPVHWTVTDVRSGTFIATRIITMERRVRGARL